VIYHQGIIFLTKTSEKAIPAGTFSINFTGTSLPVSGLKRYNPLLANNIQILPLLSSFILMQ